MKSKKTLLALALPLTLSAAFAKVQVIPRPEIDLKIMNERPQAYIFKNVKGTLLEKLNIGAPENWFNLSPVDGAEGVRSEEAYMEFGQPESDDIIVAVIDSGVDVNHEDLQGKIWINTEEVPNNGVDDDGNGYVDDVLGWNFIGGSDGMATMEEDLTLQNGLRLIKGRTEAQVDADTLEVTRELVRMKKLKARVEELGETLSASQALHLEKVTNIVSEGVEAAKKVVETYAPKLDMYHKSVEVLRAAGLSEITLESVRNLESTDEAVLKAKADLLSLLTTNFNVARATRVLNHYQGQLDFSFNEDFNPRPRVRDNYSDLNEKLYGNNDVVGPDSSHGTHVSGIIAATRDNNLGIKGVAAKVKIMAIRVVPNGDERDKDVANGIRYAVDNGAKVINMSFGKSFSPHKKVVDEAVRYAESKGVLLVHAAGNSSLNLDREDNFPNKQDQAKEREFSNWLEIGASSFKKGLDLPADFSNYGKKSVDLFAPGVDILSTTPDNKYDTYSGTSMASPTSAGVAALVLSHKPFLDAMDVRSLMLDTSRRYPNLKVNVPGTESMVLFSSLSSTGTIVDSYEAIKSLR